MSSYRDYSSSGKNNGNDGSYSGPRKKQHGDLSNKQIENDPSNGMTARERHRAYRAQIEAERAERRRQEQIVEEARRQRAFESGKSSKIMATWKLRGGAKTKAWGEVRGGFFYTGSNPSNLIEPSIQEPSLLSPRYPVAESSDGMDPVRPYPTYADMTEKQRKGYVEFLAGKRDTTKDIGFVFLYLCGLERRLIIDASKPGEVSKEEHEKIVGELLRLMKVFGPESASLRHYIAMLLLYDGRVFDMLGAKKAATLFAPDVIVNNPVKLYDKTNNEDAMAYMLAGRLAQHGESVPPRLLVEVAVNRLLRTPAAVMRGLKRDDMHNEALIALMTERVSHIDFAKNSSIARRLDEVEYPLYFPASIGIRKARKIRVDSTIIPYEEDILHVEAIVRVALSCYQELCDAREALSSKNVKNILGTSLDVLRTACPDRCALDTHLANKRESSAVPMRVVIDDIRRRFGIDLEKASRGTLSAQSQDLIAVAAAINGWQAILPSVVECPASQFVRAKNDESYSIIMFRRGVAHSTRSGKRCIGRVFGADELDYSLSVPGDWNVPTCLAYIYAWFIKQSESLGVSDTQKFSARYFPNFVPRNHLTLRKNQIRLFFSIMSSVVFSELTSRGIKSCIDAVDFSDVKDLLFSLCDDKFGLMIPADALEALETLYAKAGEDKAMVLYDYHAGTYKIVHDNDTDGFSIDEERLSETISATTGVHEILNEAFSVDDEDYDDDDIAEQPIGETNYEQNDAQNDSKATDNKSDSSAGADTASEIVRKAFGGTDEMQTDDLIAKIIEMSGAVTSAQALEFVAEANNLVPDLVEIDGSDAYLNE